LHNEFGLSNLQGRSFVVALDGAINPQQIAAAIFRINGGLACTRATTRDRPYNLPTTGANVCDIDWIPTKTTFTKLKDKIKFSK
jgi:hypothetical protein